MIEGILARPGENPGQTETQPSVAQSFAGVKNTHLTLERLKAFLFAFGRLALAQRMNAARAEIERGRERLWLGPDDAEKTLQTGAVDEDIAPDGTGNTGKANSDGCHAAETKKAASMIHSNDLSAPVFPAERREFFSFWRVLWRDAAKALERWQTAEYEELVLKRGGVMTDSLEREIAARVARSRCL